MSIFIWSDALYATKVPEVDAQHRRLFELTNNFYDAFKQLRGQEELAKLFNELLVYVEEHFALEESLMAKYNFPGYAAHRGLHRELTSLLKDKAERFAAGEIRMSSEMMEFLSQWLDQHISVVDREFAEFLRPKLALRG